MTVETDEVRNWLRDTWSVTVPADWLHACIEWIRTENEVSTDVY